MFDESDDPRPAERCSTKEYEGQMVGLVPNMFAELTRVLSSLHYESCCLEVVTSLCSGDC